VTSLGAIGDQDHSLWSIASKKIKIGADNRAVSIGYAHSEVDAAEELSTDHPARVGTQGAGSRSKAG